MKTKEYHAGLAAYILGLKQQFTFNGTKEEAQALSEVLNASRRLYTLLQENNDAEVISEALETKSAKAAQYKKLFKEPWHF